MVEFRPRTTQDPTLSLPRQLTNCEQAAARIGGEIVAHFYDVESGDSTFNARGVSKGLVGFDIPIPRDGGLIDLLQEAPDSRFDVVICESINRFARNPSVTFRAEDELREAGVKLWAIDEPWEESFGSIVLRYVNVGLARGYVYELKVKSRQGLEAACRQGRHMGGIPLYGYKFREVEHPNPYRAQQGRRMRLLESDPVREPVVRSIFEWYATAGLSIREIAERLNSDQERYPPPIPPDPRRALGRWSRSSIWEILHNPKYTGYQVWNRRARKKKNRNNPPDAWIWSEKPAHEPLVSKEIFEKAASRGASNANAGRRSRADRQAQEVARADQPLLLRSLIRCGVCSLRMQGHRNRGSHYYSCEAHRRTPELLPDGHPSTVYLSEVKAVDKIVLFLNTHVFGPDRLPRLEEILDSDDSEASEAAEEISRLRGELASIEGKIKRQLGHLEAEDPSSQGASALRDRLRELADLKLKKERQLGSEERAVAARPSIKTASALLERLPISIVDVDRMGKAAFRDLLRILSFEGSFEPYGRFLDVSVMLLPELAAEDGPFTRVLSVLLTGQYSKPRVGECRGGPCLVDVVAVLNACFRGRKV